MNFKKLLSVFLCVIMMLSCVSGLTVFAEEIEPDPEIPYICEHENVRYEEEVIEEGDCYHFREVAYRTVCEDCGDTIAEDIVVNPYYTHGETYHVFGETPATCLSPGSFFHQDICSICGQAIRYGAGYYAQVEHDILVDTGMPICYETRYDETPATCTEDGSRTPYVWCTECEIEVSRDETEVIPSTGHEWGDWQEVNGHLERGCKNCDAKEIKDKEPEPPTEEPEEENILVKLISTIANAIRTFVQIFTRLFK